MSHPYKGLEPRAFWTRSVGDRHYLDITDLATPKHKLDFGDQVATAGSCFAQHIARQLRSGGFGFLDAEPAPSRLPAADHQMFGYGMFSARYGNIYTSRQLLQLWYRAHDQFVPADPVWASGGRFYDPFRPSIEAGGFASAGEVLQSQASHLAAVRGMFRKTNVFIFTLGLTELWSSRADGAAYPTCPGTLAGSFDPDRHVFTNLTHHQVLTDMTKFLGLMRRTRPGIRLILTVSPVPLAATMSGQHVLTATTYSKSVLRAVAGELAATHDDVDYFPSYEIITAPAFHGAFYDHDKREVRPEGVDFVMKQFQWQFCAAPRETVARLASRNEEDVLCDERVLESFAP